jgi:hypothetical protein
MNCVKGDKKSFDKKKKFKIVEKFEDEEPRDIQDNPDLVTQMKRATINDVPPDVMNHIMGKYLGVADKAKLATVGVKVKMTDEEKEEKKKLSAEYLEKIISWTDRQKIIDNEAFEYQMLKFYLKIERWWEINNKNKIKKDIRNKMEKAIKLYDEFLKKNEYPYFSKLFKYYIDKNPIDKMRDYNLRKREENNEYFKGSVYNNKKPREINLIKLNKIAEEINDYFSTYLENKIKISQVKINEYDDILIRCLLMHSIKNDDLVLKIAKKTYKDVDSMYKEKLSDNDRLKKFYNLTDEIKLVSQNTHISVYQYVRDEINNDHAAQKKYRQKYIRNKLLPLTEEEYLSAFKSMPKENRKILKNEVNMWNIFKMKGVNIKNYFRDIDN